MKKMLIIDCMVCVCFATSEAFMEGFIVGLRMKILSDICVESPAWVTDGYFSVPKLDKILVKSNMKHCNLQMLILFLYFSKNMDIMDLIISVSFVCLEFSFYGFFQRHTFNSMD